MSAMNDMLESEFQLQQEIKSLRQQLLLKEHHYDVMKASAEVLAEQCEKYRQQLAAAQEELENEQAKGIHSCHANCTMDGCVNRKLREQLNDARVGLIYESDIAEMYKEQLAAVQATWLSPEAYEALMQERQETLQQLAEALAACKLKDEALRFYKSALTADDVAGRALAIQPDDAALKTWLGKPVAWLGHEYCVGYQHAPDDTPLYAPKGMTK